MKQDSTFRNWLRNIWLENCREHEEFRELPYSLKEYWSTLCETGTMGDPSSSTAEKGELILATAARELEEVIKELRERPIRPRKKHQSQAAQERNQRLHGEIPRFTN